MTESNIIEMLHLMGVNHCKPNSKHSHIISSCPVATWNHKKGTDNTPSFSVKIDGTGKSVGHCFACSFGGTMMQLAKEYGSHVHSGNIVDFLKKNENYPDDYFKPQNDGKFGRKLDWARARWLFGDNNGNEKRKFDEVAAVPFDEDKVEAMEWKLIEKYMKSIPQYVLNRGITKEMAKIWRLGYNKAFQRVMMPEIDRRNRLVGYSQRAIGKPKGDFPKYLFNTGFVKMNFLYGEHLITADRGDIILVEGQFDALKIYQAGYNVLALRGSELSVVQARKIIELLPAGRKVILMMDGDDAGRKITVQAFEMLKDDVQVIKRTLKEGEDPGDLNTKQILDLILTNEYK